MNNLFPVQLHLSLFSSGSLVYLLLVSTFFGGMVLGEVSIYKKYFYNKVLYLGSNILPQCSSPDGLTFVLPVTLLLLF